MEINKYFNDTHLCAIICLIIFAYNMDTYTTYNSLYLHILYFINIVSNNNKQ